MPPLETIAALLAAYIAVVILLLSLNIASRWRWWVKVSATLLCGVLFVVSFLGMKSLLGWPSGDQVPDRFNLIATRIVEPNRQVDEIGSIYLWLELIDEDNIPSGKPLSYRIAYSDELARAADQAQDLIDQGSAVEATLREVTEEESEIEESGPLATTPAASGPAGEPGEHVEGLNLVFNDMPPVRLPEKGAL